MYYRDETGLRLFEWIFIILTILVIGCGIMEDAEAHDGTHNNWVVIGDSNCSFGWPMIVTAVAEDVKMKDWCVPGKDLTSVDYVWMTEDLKGHHTIQGVIISLGTNDALRKVPPAEYEDALKIMIDLFQQRKLKVGCALPPTNGLVDVEEYRWAMFRNCPFTFEQVPHFKKDGIHLNSWGQLLTALIAYRSVTQ